MAATIDELLRELPMRRLSQGDPSSTPATTLLEDWLQSESRILLISGAPGSGKSTTIASLAELARARGNDIDVIDDFPPDGKQIQDLGSILHENRVAITTQVQVEDMHAGLTQYLEMHYSHLSPWVAAIEPISSDAIATF